MKMASYFLCGTLLAGLGTGSASADPITVKLTGHVVGRMDRGNYLDGQAQVGEAVTATYVYDTSTPDLEIDPLTGNYEPSAAQGASIRVDVGSLTFQSLPTSQFSAHVIPHSPPDATGYWSMTSINNKPLANGTWVNLIMFQFTQPTGAVPASDDLPADAPDVQAFAHRVIEVEGGPWGRMGLTVEIDSAEIVPPAIEVFPAGGSFLSQQRFDAAVLLPVGAQVASMQASVNGSPVAFNFPGTCQELPPNGSGRPAILCPDAHTVLASMAGNRVDWQVTLTDGTVYTDYVRWDLIP